MKSPSKLPVWKKAYFNIDWEARYKSNIGDFKVIEELSFQLDDFLVSPSNGEHLYVFIEKASLTTHQAVSLFAEYFGVKTDSIGYAGLKDKNAITQQWLSIYLPGKVKQIDVEMLTGSNLVTAVNAVGKMSYCKILKAGWHRAKLRRGAISRNYFNIICRSQQLIPASLEQRLKLIVEKGFPNYFGEQRFGFNGSNIDAIGSWFNGGYKPDKTQQGLLLSAARSWLFNHSLQARVELNNWDKAIEGDCFMLEGSRKYFIEQSITEETINRCRSGDIHPSGVLWGASGSELTRVAKEIEDQAIDDFEDWRSALKEKNVASSQRAFRCMPQHLSWKLLTTTELQLQFSLPSGCYATSLLRELGNVSEKKSV